MAERISARELATLEAVKAISAQRRPEVAEHATATEVAKRTRQTRNAERVRLARLATRKLLSKKPGQTVKHAGKGARYVTAYRVNRNGDRAVAREHRAKAAA